MSGNINIFNNYNYNNFFVETGCFEGRGIGWAIEANFKNIISIEINPKYFELCKDKFKDVKNLNLILGDSSTILWDVIKNINEPITFWLDAHFMYVASIIGECGNLPTLHELDIIKRHTIKTHTILIDDIRVFQKNHPDYHLYGKSELDLRNKIFEINENYKITYDDGYIQNDVMVAMI